jgi:hypothetical protein
LGSAVGHYRQRRDAPYRSGCGKDWLKIKCTQSDSFQRWPSARADLGGYT